MLDNVRSAGQDGRSSEASVVYFGNEFPNDDLKDLFRRLLQRSKDRRYRVLASFLEEATLVLKQEIAELPYPARDELPHFDNLITLAEHGDFRDGSLGAAMESAFLVVLQLGMLIGYVFTSAQAETCSMLISIVGTTKHTISNSTL